MEFTVLGARGFIGSRLIRWFQSQGLSYWDPERHEDVFSRKLGHAIYCIGLTADFRERPFDTIRAHVCDLLGLLEKAHFESFLYLSSTRLYRGTEHTREDESLRVNPMDRDDLYNISKIMGESACLGSRRTNVRIARLSNVYGDDFLSGNFVASIVREAVDHGRICLNTGWASEKDYVDVSDVARLLPQIARSGRSSIYNVASGFNTTHADLLAVVQNVTGCAIEVAEGAPDVRFPPICQRRVQQEFGFVPSSRITTALPGLIHEYERQRSGRPA